MDKFASDDFNSSEELSQESGFDDYSSEEDNVDLKRKREENEDLVINKKQKNDKRELTKPVTAEELNQLREIENLYNSNLFRIQIEEMLTEINVKTKQQTNFTNWYETFQNFLKNLPEYDDISLSHIKTISKKKLTKEQKFINNLLQNNENKLNCDQDLIIKFIKPASSNIFGLYKIKSIIGPKLNVNINIEMQKTCFNEKDYLNNRYFVKRYYYIKYLAAELSKSNITSNITYNYHMENNLLPILTIIPKDLRKIQVNIYITPAKNYFKPSRCLPEKNNIKINIFKDKFHDVEDDELNLGTILYNSTLLHDITLDLNTKYVEETISEHKNVQDGIKLLLIWLKQRELNVGFGCFYDDLIPLLMAYLITHKRVNKHMSSYQVIRNFWIFFSTTDLNKNPISLCDDVKYEQFKENFDVIFIDRSGCYNLTSFLSLDFYKKIKFESELAVKYLDDNKFNSFTALFMTSAPFCLQFDTILSIQSVKEFRNVYKKIDGNIKCKCIGFYNYIIIKKIIEILKQGLTNRIVNIVPYIKNSCKQFDKIMFGINLNQEKAFSIIERGPLPTHPKVKEFLDYWEDLVHFRRFPDGTACDAVYFETKTIKDRRDIIKKIINFIVERKLKLKHVLYFNDFDKMLILKNISAPYPIGTNEESSLKVISISDDLNKILRGLTLPLEIISVQGISDVFSYTDIFPPFSANHTVLKKITTVNKNNIIFNNTGVTRVPKYIAPVECVIQLSHHSKWPNNLEAIRHIKLAFYLKIAELLERNNEIKCNVKFDHLDLYYKGIVFRYRLYVHKEVSYLKKEITSSGLVAYKDTEESLMIEKQLNVLPKIIGALKGIQSVHPSYGPSTALIKRWLRSQLIDEFYISDTVINLLNAFLYLNSAPFTVPNLPQVAFLRFLKFLTELNWELEPVIVNFNNDLTKEQLDEIENEFRKNRQNYSNLFIIMPCDEGKSLFTKSSPSKEILRRVSILAKETFDIALNAITEQTLLEIDGLFLPNLDGYDIIIYLQHQLIAKRDQQIANKSDMEIRLKEFDSELSTNIPIVGFDPVANYLKELRKYYGQFALFFYDSYGGSYITVLWKPSALESKDFKVSQIDGRKLVNDKLILNCDAIIEDFQILGKGLVKNIEIINAK